MHQMIEIIKNKYGNSPDIVVRKIHNITYIYLESLSSDDKISNFLNKSITDITNIENLKSILKNSIYNSHIITSKNIDESYYYLSSGFTCIFLDNENEYIVIETKGKLDRGVTESTMEPIIRGPKDSFTENHSINIGLIRKRIKDPNLWIIDTLIGKRTNTKVSIIYDKEIAIEKNVNKIHEKIKKINIDAIIDSSYIRNYLEGKSVFPSILSTERPDLVCQNILNGKIVILVENSPIALILPATLDDFLKSAEDYYQKATSATFSRVIRYIALVITILTPALYIALMTFNQEMIPDQLLISLAAQRSKVPFPTFVEVLIFIIIFEILREADIRAPSISGASMSIVGAVVLGDAAVSADIVSPIVIIVVAITSICEMIFSDVDMANAIRQWRIIFILSTILTGMIGIVSVGIIFITKLCDMENLGVPYLIPFSPINKNLVKDSIILAPTKKRTKRPNYLTDNLTKAGEA